MPDVIKVGFNIRIDNIVALVVTGFSYLLQRHFCTALWSESVGVILEVCFEQWLNHQLYRHLYDPILYGRDS
ncbi:hypothetical protein SDC9_153578 [bioreactor metagenome]|uniref:Uncharacterized protein n=1 Tax=bioreactor metagenome TaxID=1076179 RepID=A0A645EYJ6_9ZZZZ